MGSAAPGGGPSLARWQAQVPLAATMRMTARARALRAEGRDIISLTLGEPECTPPPGALQAAVVAAHEGRTGYPALAGEQALREALSRKFRASAREYAPADILIGNGARQVIYDALIATLDAGDEVIVPVPYWNAYPLIAEMAGASAVYVACDPADGFRLAPDALARAISSRTKWIVLNFPNNPSGAVCDPVRLRAIAEVVRRHPQIWILSDEIYEDLIFDGSANPSLVEVAPDLRDRILVVSGFSKTHAMTGWRVGYGAGPQRLIEAMAKVQSQATGGVSHVAQAAALGALAGGQAHVAAMRAAYARRTARVAETLSALPGVSCMAPAAAFYVFPEISALCGKMTPAGYRICDDWQFCDRLLEEEGIALVPGSAFGSAQRVRISCAADDDALARACARLTKFVRGLEA